MIDAEDARGAGPEELEPLFQGMASEDPETMALAVRGLGRMEDPGLLGRIEPLLSSSHSQVRAEAANAMGQAVFRTSGDGVARTLLDLLGQEADPGVRGAMGRTVGRLRYEGRSTALEAEEALVGLTLNGMEDAAPQALTGAVMGLEWMARLNREGGLQDASVDRLRALASFGRFESNRLEAARVRRVALMALSAAEAVDSETGFGALADPDPDVRRLALVGLGRGAASAATVDAVSVALEDPVARVRTQAVEAWAALGPPDARCSGLLAAARDPEVQVAVTALDHLAGLCQGDSEAVAFLRDLVDSAEAATSHGWHRGAHALVALAALAPDGLGGPSDAASPLERFLTHASPFARAYAARAATQVGRADALEPLASDADSNVRTAAVQGLSRIRGHEVDPLLIDQLAQDDGQLIMTAARLLEGTPDPVAAIEPLLEALGRASQERRETARDPRMALLARIAEVGEPDQAEELLPYLTDYDGVVARRVAEILTEWTGEARQADPRPIPRVSVPTPADVERLDRSRVVLEMEGGGEITISLLGTLAPTNAARFERLARAGYFDGLTFHRVEPNFVIQGGSPGANEMAGDGPFTRDEIGLQPNWRGTVGLSTRGRDTGDGQIFVNLVDNLRLDHNYTIFGEVTEGMDVVDRVVEGQVIVRARVEER
jgi:cyclophilin family peptidyl-prolyl cis-trans isomerase/HEAT repeat protein